MILLKIFAIRIDQALKKNDAENYYNNGDVKTSGKC